MLSMMLPLDIPKITAIKKWIYFEEMSPDEIHFHSFDATQMMKFLKMSKVWKTGAVSDGRKKKKSYVNFTLKSSILHPLQNLANQTETTVRQLFIKCMLFWGVFSVSIPLLMYLFIAVRLVCPSLLELHIFYSHYVVELTSYF